MKTTIFLVLLSLSFSFIPQNLYNRDNLKAVADVMEGSALESLKDVKSSDSSDNLIFEMRSDEGDWISVVSEIIELVKPLVTNFTEALEYLSTITDTNIDRDLLISIARFVNETLQETGLSGDAIEKENQLFNSSFTNTTEDYEDYSEYPEYRFNNTDSSLERDMLISMAQFVNETIQGKNLSGEAIGKDNELFNSSFTNTTQDYEDYPEYPEYNRSNNSDVNLERDLSFSIARFINETRQEKDLSGESGYLFIEIDFESDSSDNESDIIQKFKPLFMNFTEAYSQYLSTNNVNLEDQLLYDDILTSIAQLFNETVEEKAFYSDTLEKNNTVEADNSEDQDESNFLGW